MRARSERRANLLAALLAYVVLALLALATWKLLLTDEFIYPDHRDIAEHCEEQAAERHEPESIQFRRNSSSCRSQLETDPFS